MVVPTINPDYEIIGKIILLGSAETMSGYGFNKFYLLTYSSNSKKFYLLYCNSLKRVPYKSSLETVFKYYLKHGSYSYQCKIDGSVDHYCWKNLESEFTNKLVIEPFKPKYVDMYLFKLSI